MITYKYEAILKTVELGSLTKAAEALGYTQSGITHIINSVEAEFNLKLLVRDRAGVYLTPEGAKLLPYLEEACDAVRVLMNQVNALSESETGVVKVGIFSSIATHVLPDMIAGFAAQHPEVTIETLPGNYDEIESWLLHGIVDIGFTVLPTRATLEVWPVIRDEIMVVLPRGHALETYEKIPCEKLNDYPFITYSGGFTRDCCLVPNITTLHQNAKYKSQDDTSIFAMIEKGLGITLKANLLLERTPFELSLRELDPPVYRDIAIAAKSRKALPQAAGQFLDYMLETLKKTARKVR